MSDRDTPNAVRLSAVRLATVVAVPLALLAGFGSYAALGGFDDGRGSSTGQRVPTGAEATPTTSAGRSTGAVTMPAPALADRAELVCRALLSQLPDRLRDRDRRPVTSGAEQNAAYGDPPITVACGTAAASFAPTDLVYALDGVCWHAASTAETTVWTTVDREVPIRVTVPASYQQPGQWVIEFSSPVISTVPARANVPSGCKPSYTG